MVFAAFSPDGRLALTAGDAATPHLWDVTTRGEARLAVAGRVQAVAFSPDGLLTVAGCEDGTLRILDLEARREVRRTPAHNGMVMAVAVSSDGKRVVSAGVDREAKVWDLETGRLLHTLVGHRETVFGAAFSPADPRLALTSSGDRTVRAWDVETGRERGVFEGHKGNVYAVAFSADGARAITPGDNERHAKIWDVASGREIARVDTPGTMLAAAFAPDGRHALVCSVSTIRLVDIETGKPVRTYDGHHNFVRRLVFMPDGRCFISVAADRMLNVWDFERGGLVRSFVGDSRDMGGAAFSPRANLALSAGIDGLRVWDFDLPARHRAFDSALDTARKALARDPKDSAALAVLGEWYAFRGMPDWAVDLLEAARAHGAKISSLTLARCHWQAGNGRAARREFERALAEPDAPAAYVRVCLGALPAND